MPKTDPLAPLLAALKVQRSSPPVSVDWDAVVQGLGTDLPPDYMALMDRCGGGSVADLLLVYDPAASQAALNLIEAQAKYVEAQEIAARYGDSPKYQPHPAPSGVLPWGHSSQGDQLLWRTKGKPESWTVVVENPRAAIRYEEHRCGLVAFLHGVISGRIKTDIFPEGFPDPSPVYKPARRKKATRITAKKKATKRKR